MKFEVAKIANQALQSKMNHSIIFNYLREKGPTSRMDISRNLKISASAVTRVINTLRKRKYVVEAGKVETPLGKRPTLIRINAEKGSVLAVDLSQDRLKIGLYDFTGRLLKKQKSFRISGKKNEVDKLVREIREFLENYLKESRKSFKKLNLSSISIGIPADIDEEKGKILSASLYEEWYDINFKERLEHEFKIPVLVMKDVTLSVLAEKRVGQGKNSRNIVFIEISSGVSAGIISDDQLIRGASGSAGQIAFSVINGNSLSYRHENKGYLDKFASVKSIKERIEAKIKQGGKSSVLNMVENDLDKIEPELVCKAALEGDELANQILTDIVQLLSFSLTNLILVINPEVMILGGRVSKLPGVQELFAARISENIKKLIPFTVPEIKISSLGEDVVLVGASLWAIDTIIATQFPYKLRD
ncbi:MAG: ROK family protein [Spirochaetales bacterium]|nr:ROK family protein [Spirochaetales bacterium]